MKDIKKEIYVFNKVRDHVIRNIWDNILDNVGYNVGHNVSFNVNNNVNNVGLLVKQKAKEL
jgi:hypothetical protein